MPAACMLCVTQDMLVCAIFDGLAKRLKVTPADVTAIHVTSNMVKVEIRGHNDQCIVSAAYSQLLEPGRYSRPVG